MTRLFFTTLFLAFSAISLAQTSNVSIKVNDSETDEPLLGATVYFEEIEINTSLHCTTKKQIFKPEFSLQSSPLQKHLKNNNVIDAILANYA